MPLASSLAVSWAPQIPLVSPRCHVALFSWSGTSLPSTQPGWVILLLHFSAEMSAPRLPRPLHRKHRHYRTAPMKPFYLTHLPLSLTTVYFTRMQAPWGQGVTFSRSHYYWLPTQCSFPPLSFLTDPHSVHVPTVLCQNKGLRSHPRGRGWVLTSTPKSVVSFPCQ